MVFMSKMDIFGDLRRLQNSNILEWLSDLLVIVKQNPVEQMSSLHANRVHNG